MPLKHEGVGEDPTASTKFYGLLVKSKSSFPFKEAVVGENPTQPTIIYGPVAQSE